MKLSIIILQVAICISALLAIGFYYHENNLFHIFFKPLTTILIILFAFFNGIKTTGYFKYVLAGLIFCLGGDVFLMFDGYFVWGLGSFLIAHLLFTFAFISISGFTKNLLSLMGLLLFGVSYYLFLYNSLEDLALPVLVYFVAIITMSWQGINLSLNNSNRAFNLIALAVILFLFSDSVIAWTKFHQDFNYSKALILITYWISIFLIAESTRSIDAKYPTHN